MKDIITKYENEAVIELNDDNSQFFEMLEDFAERNSANDATALRLICENGVKIIKAADYSGLVKFNNGTQLEIYPKVGGGIAQAKKMLCRMAAAYLDIPFEANMAAVLERHDSSFMEFFVSVFVRECMKILKSGLLMGYTSVEENSSAMQGSIMFSENIRKNLAHRERMYVRHDVFTPDRSENQLIKTAASVMMKLTRISKNEQELKKLLIYLDDVKFSNNCELDFANCVNTRNAKKYTVVLNICRMILKKKGALTGKYVSQAIMFPIRDIFRAYILRLVKEKCRDKIVKMKPTADFRSIDGETVSICPDIAVYDKNNTLLFIIDTCWSFAETADGVPETDMSRFYEYAKKMKCGNIFAVYPSNGEREPVMLTDGIGRGVNITAYFADISGDSGVPDKSHEYERKADIGIPAEPSKADLPVIEEELSEHKEVLTEPVKKPKKITVIKRVKRK